MKPNYIYYLLWFRVGCILAQTANKMQVTAAHSKLVFWGHGKHYTCLNLAKSDLYSGFW